AREGPLWGVRTARREGWMSRMHRRVALCCLSSLPELYRVLDRLGTGAEEA
ncbi:MAG: hypothetical protein ACI9K2_007537, partial [Myxococcota bacterium]